MKKDSLKSLRKQVTGEIQEEKIEMACTHSTMSVESPPVLTTEGLVPYKKMQNFNFILFYLASPQGQSPLQREPITVGPYYLTHLVNFSCGRKPEYPEKTHEFR